MLQVIDGIKAIGDKRPPQLPAVDLPALPELDAVGPLADIAGVDPSAVLEAGEKLVGDRAAIDAAVEQARPLIEAAGRDLVALALELGQQAIPIAAAALLPVPGMQQLAEARLTALVNEFLARATQRLAQLMTELAEIAAPLIDIAATEAERVITSSGEKAVDKLEQTAANPGEFHATAGTESTLIPAADTDAPAGSAPAGSAPTGDSPGDNASGQAAVAAAMAQRGTPYAWGGTGNGGFDCSGLTQYAWAQAGVDIPRTAEQQAVGRQVTAEELQAGDLVVWDGHVAMYAGDGMMVEAGDPVQTNPLRTTNLDMAFKGFWRPTG